MNSQPVEHILLNFRNTPFPDAVCVGSKQGDPVVAAVFVKEDVVVEFAGAEEFDPVVEVGVRVVTPSCQACAAPSIPARR